MQQERLPSKTQETIHRLVKLPSLKQTLLLVTLLLSVLLISVFAHEYSRFPVDLTVELHIQAFDSSLLEQAMKVISLLGDRLAGIVLVLIAALLFFWNKNRRNDSLMLVAAGLLSQFYLVLKELVERPRPSSDLVSVIQNEQSSGFPSGHATFAVAFFGALFYLLSIHIGNLILKRIAQLVIIVFILLQGISRVYLGAHWPSDVLGGYLLGGLILATLVLIHKRVEMPGKGD